MLMTERYLLDAFGLPDGRPSRAKTAAVVGTPAVWVRTSTDSRRRGCSVLQGVPDHLQAPGGELHGEGVGVAAGVADLLDAGVHDHLHAHQARLVGAVDRRALDRDAMVSGLDNGVLLCVQGALATRDRPRSG